MKKLFLLPSLMVFFTLALGACEISISTDSDDTKSETETNTEETNTPNEDPVITDETQEIIFNTPESVEMEDLLPAETITEIKTIVDKEYPDQWETYKNLFIFKKVGTIQKGIYKDNKLVLLDLGCDGMCFSTDLYKFTWDPTTKKLVNLTKHNAINLEPVYVAPILTNKDDATIFEQIVLPEEIAIPGTDKVIKLVEPNYTYYIDAKYNEGVREFNVAFEDPKIGKVYFNPFYRAEPKPQDNYINSELSLGESSLYIVMQDGSKSLYAFDPELTQFPNENTKANVTWADSKDTASLTDTYTNENMSGCGLGASYDIIKLNENNLKIAGTSSNGIDLYEVADPNGNTTVEQRKLKDVYQTYVDTQKAIAGNKGTKPMTYEEFLAVKPLLFFRDPFNRWSSLIHKAYLPAAECGKPVIYLYPETKTDISVNVDVIKFSETIPEYNNGWNVTAYPNGTLVNKADNQVYPYLYWEGEGHSTYMPKQGFLVERNELETFLNESLDKLGLIRQEKADFMEFWLTRMLNNKEDYFFITFVGTNDFNKVAPLNIDPKPETLIRVFMFYEPTNERISVPVQKLSSIKRDGFTVLEWGGSSTKTWRK